MAQGERPGPGQIVLDRQAARRLGLAVGDSVGALGRRLRISGLAKGTASIVTSVAFVRFETFRQATGTRARASYLLVWPRRGLDSGAAARALQRDYPIRAQTRAQFSNSERRIVSDMSTGLIRGMLVIGFVVGVAVAALSMYTATTSRLREYAVLKAIGMDNRRLFGMVTRQAVITMAGALAAALVVLALMAVALPHFDDSLSIVVTAGSIARIVAITALTALVAALLPAVRLAHVDPATVYRR